MLCSNPFISKLSPRFHFDSLLLASSISLLTHSNRYISAIPRNFFSLFLQHKFRSEPSRIRVSNDLSLTMAAAKISSLSLYFTVFLFLFTTLFPISEAEIRRQSLSSQNGGVPAQELWCVAKNNAEDASLQAAIDWACSTGGADCATIQQGGPCYDPLNLQNTASYAFNDYFLKHGLSDDSCNFDNNAAITSLNPSHDNCKFPSSLKAATAINGSFSGSTSSSTLGLGGPSEDMSGCSDVTWNWSRALIISHLVLMFSLTVLG